MKAIAAKCVIVLFCILVWVASSATAAELDEHLKLFEPLLAKEWVGGFVESESADIKIVLRFDATSPDLTPASEEDDGFALISGWPRSVRWRIVS